MIAPEQFLNQNLFGGVILALFATIVMYEERSLTGVLLFLTGVALVSLVVAAMWQNRLLGRSLVAQGLLICGLGVYLTVETIVWSVTGPPRSMFRYAPGLIALSFICGLLQIAMFCARPQAASKLRLTGLILGGVLELAAASSLVLRFLR